MIILLIGYVLNALTLFLLTNYSKEDAGIVLIVFGLFGSIPYAFFLLIVYFLICDLIEKVKLK